MNENFHTIHNPYIVGNPIKDKNMFFGREDDFTFIRQKVTGATGGGILVLCGSRRSGKTSILFQIMNGRLGNEFLPVLIDMQAMAVDNDLDFLLKLGKGITDAIGDDNISLEEDFINHCDEGALNAFEHLIVKINKQLGDKKLVLLFDEYEIFESHIAKSMISTDVLHLFANWIEHKEGVFIVFTGSDKLEERTAEYWNHFLGKALHRRVSFLSRRDTLRLIEQPVRDVIRYEEGLPELIYALTAGHPFYTQVFCQALIDHLNEVQEYDLTSKDLQGVIDQIIENPLPQMIFSWNSLDNLEKLTLSVIGELNRDARTPVEAKDILAFAKNERIGFNINHNALNETLEKLFHHDMLSKDSGRDVYSFKMDLWRRWTARMHSIWKVIDEIKSGEGKPSRGLRRRGKRRAPALLAAGALVTIIAIASYIIGDRFPGREDQTQRIPVDTMDSTRVTIHTIPSGADVFFGEKRTGKSPIDGRLVPVDATPLRIELVGYKAHVETLDLRKDEPFQTSVTLVEQTGSLTVTSTPSGARIYLGIKADSEGKPTDLVTPATLKELSVNHLYWVTAKLPGYDQKKQPGVQVLEDLTSDIHLNLVRSADQIQIDTQPKGATITIDDRVVGETPDFLTLEHGVYRLVLNKAGYEPIEREIRIPTADNMIRVTLTRLTPGTLIITVNPWASIYVDGELKEEQGIRWESPPLEPGVYTVVLRNPHYEPLTEAIEILSDSRTERNYDLTKKRAP